MRVDHRRINFEDKRGTITDIFYDSPKQHITVLTCAKGSVRGNHYHKKSVQYTFVIDGEFTAYHKKVGSKKVTRVTLRKYDLMTHLPNEVHEFVATKKSIMLAMVDGKRGGKDFEGDTFRVETPLHVEFRRTSKK